MEVQYSKTKTHAIQALTKTYETDIQTLFHYFSTNKGIQQWFPELSFDEDKLYFQLENQTPIAMHIWEYTKPTQIKFEWATGTVEMTLTALSPNETSLHLHESLPQTIEHLGMDFAGWQYKIDALKMLIEKGHMPNQSEFDFKARATQILDILKLK